MFKKNGETIFLNTSYPGTLVVTIWILFV